MALVQTRAQRVSLCTDEALVCMLCVDMSRGGDVAAVCAHRIAGSGCLMRSAVASEVVLCVRSDAEL